MSARRRPPPPLRRPDNPPARPAIDARIGDHRDFRRLLLDGLSDSRYPALRGLTTRDPADFTLALLDAWAAACDVVTFYQERIASEALLRCAEEPESVAHLAELVGHRPRPAIAATALVAFTLDDTLPPRVDVTIPAGAQVESVPPPGGLPQRFETDAPLAARPAWSRIDLAPAREPDGDAILDLRGAPPELRVGAPLLLDDADDPSAAQLVLVRALDRLGDRTRVRFAAVGLAPPPRGRLRVLAPRRQSAARPFPDEGPGIAGDGVLVPVDAAPDQDDRHERLAVVEGPLAALYPVTVRAPQGLLVAFEHHGDPLPSPRLFTAAGARLHWEWRPLDLADIDVSRESGDGVDPAAMSRETVELPLPPLLLASARLHLRAGDGLLLQRRGDPGAWRFATVAAAEPDRARDLTRVRLAAAGPRWLLPLDGPVDAFVLRQRAPLFGHSALPRRRIEPDAPSDTWPGYDLGDAHVDLDGARADLLAPAPLVLVDARGPQRFTALRVEVGARADFGLAGPATRVHLAAAARDLAGFDRRGTLAHLGAEPVAVVADPESPVSGDILTVVGDLTDLPRGRDLVIERDPEDPAAGPRAEAVRLVAAAADGERTRLTVTPPLRGLYRPGHARVLANVAVVGHGERVDAILGSGDPRQPFQAFALRSGPLTHRRERGPAGHRPDLEVRVDGVRWRPVDRLADAAPGDNVYEVQRAADGRVLVRFGDGESGARLPAGDGNVTATYRVGAGLSGQVDAGQLSELQSPLTAVAELRNPLPAEGSADAETPAEARVRAPLGVLTLGRVVALADYAAFARAYPGVAKAHATWLAATRTVLLTLAGPRGAAIDPQGPLARDLLAALRAAGDPFQRLDLRSFTPAPFELRARLTVAVDHRPGDVLRAARDRARDRFGFDARDFAAPVERSAVIAALQATPGVDAVALTRLRRRGAPSPDLPPRLRAAPAAAGRPAELLLLHDEDLELEVTP